MTAPLTCCRDLSSHRLRGYSVQLSKLRYLCLGGAMIGGTIPTEM
jgi:hypothetical protein